MKAFVRELVISYMSEVIARHSRSYGREEMISWHGVPWTRQSIVLTVQPRDTPLHGHPVSQWFLPYGLGKLGRPMPSRL